MGNIIVILGVLLLMAVVSAVYYSVSLRQEVRKQQAETEFRRSSISFLETYNLVGLPIVTFSNNGKSWNFLLDTGSIDSQIDVTALQGIQHNMLPIKAQLFGIDGQDVSVNFCEIALEYKNREYTGEFVIHDYKQAFDKTKEEFGVQLHGIIGSKFFKKYKYVLNFDELIAYSKKPEHETNH